MTTPATPPPMPGPALRAALSALVECGFNE